MGQGEEIVYGLNRFLHVRVERQGRHEVPHTMRNGSRVGTRRSTHYLGPVDGPWKCTQCKRSVPMCTVCQGVSQILVYKGTVDGAEKSVTKRNGILIGKRENALDSKSFSSFIGLKKGG